MSNKYIKNAIIDNARRTRKASRLTSQKNLFVEKDVILAVPTTGTEFYACDVIKVVDNGVDSYPKAVSFDGTEEQNPTDDADKYIVGVVQIGNGTTDVDTIQVRIGGSMEVRLGDRTTPVVVGAKLYIDKNNLDACVAEGDDNVGDVPLFEAMEASTDSNETVIQARFLSGGVAAVTYNGPFTVEQKDDTTITIKASDGETYLGKNRITAGLESLISGTDVDVAITTSGSVYAQITYSGGLVVAYANVATLPTQTNGNVYITIAEVLFSGGAITKITQIQRNEIHVAGRIVGSA